jgi:hypothetical protein
MNIIEKQHEFLSLQVLPARLDVFQTAWLLGFKPHDIPVLAAAGLLKPLGNPARNCVKHYATETLQQFRRDEKWLARASDIIRQHWHDKNARKQTGGVGKTLQSQPK